MSINLKESSPLEMTLNLASLTKGDSWRWKAKQCIKRIRQHILREFKRPGSVKIDPEVNTFILKNGMHNIPRKIRIKLEREISDKDSQLVYKVGLVECEKFSVPTIKET
ncbi:60S ribosomal protein L31 [Cucumispora dikerogammari]|nr:60S ribosomal protein L31 [Cucumispora dikerogammari]